MAVTYSAPRPLSYRLYPITLAASISTHSDLRFSFIASCASSTGLQATMDNLCLAKKIADCNVLRGA
jgi:hypothetical protein